MAGLRLAMLQVLRQWRGRIRRRARLDGNLRARARRHPKLVPEFAALLVGFIRDGEIGIDNRIARGRFDNFTQLRDLGLGFLIARPLLAISGEGGHIDLGEHAYRLQLRPEPLPFGERLAFEHRWRLADIVRRLRLEGVHRPLARIASNEIENRGRLLAAAPHETPPSSARSAASAGTSQTRCTRSMGEPLTTRCGLRWSR